MCVLDDPTEEFNLADTMPGKVAEMSDRLDVLAASEVEVDFEGMEPIPEGDPNLFGGAWTPGFC